MADVAESAPGAGDGRVSVTSLTRLPEPGEGPRQIALQQAVALAYDPANGPPRVVAKGRGAIADAILMKAREHGVYVHESRELLALLMQVDLDRHIPVQLYRAVAELLAWLHRVDAGLLDSNSGPPRLTLPEHDVS